MAWAFVGVSDVVQVTAASHALVTTGITGLAAGDLLVACISSRIASTTSITLPTGGEWTLVSEQKNNNTLTTGSAAASGLMAYCLRGASNPNLTFTHPTAPSVALGRIVAYRNVATTSPLDTQTSFTTAISTTAVSGAGLTTTQEEDLIVAMAAGGQEAAWSSFNATNPNGASSGTSSLAPTTTWRERADSLTTTGADTSLAIFDAVKLTSGATGNLTATASVAAAHAIIAGAFKIVYVPGWNSADKSAGITLSNSDKTATTTTAGDGVRSAKNHVSGTAGKYYAELVFDTIVGPDPVLGIKDVTTSPLGDSGGTVRVLPASGNIYSSTLIGSVGSACTSGDAVCIAWDAGAERIWFRKNNGLWNNDAVADPATGTNGLDVSSMANVGWALWMGNGNAGAARVATIRTESAEFSYAGPSGFTSWMGEALVAPPVTGTGTLAGQASAVSGTGEAGTLDAWNAVDKSASITLSNADKTLTTVSLQVGIRSTTTHLNETAGKFYAEFLLENITSGIVCVGIHNLTATVSGITGASCHLRTDSGYIYVNNGLVDEVTSGGPIVNGDIACIAWDSGAQRVWFRINAGDWNDSPTANPATNTGGINYSVAAAVGHALWFATTDGVRVVTLRTESAEFSYAGPSGFTSWMGEALVAIGTGAVSADIADLDGAGLSATLGSGALPSDVATLAGEGTVGDVGITGTGALTNPGSVVFGAGISSSTGTGTLAGQASAVSGTGTVNILDAWNAVDKSANITLSNSDKTATLTAAVTSGVRSTTKYLNGTETKKLYAEFLLTNAISGFSCQVGIREASAALNTSAGSTFQCATNSGNIVTGSATIIGNIGGAPLLDGDVVCIAWSPSTERGWFRKNGGLWNNDAAADPATNTNGFDISVLNNTDHALLFLAASSLNGAIVTIRTEVAEFTYTVPSGFTSWMGEALAATGTGAVAADASVVSGSGVSESVATGALAAQAATAGGAGISSSSGSGALVADAATVESVGVSASAGTGAVQAGAATVAGAGLGGSTGTGTLLAGQATVTGEGVVLEEGATLGTGALVAGAATVSGEGEVTGEVVVPPVSVGGGYYRPQRPFPVEGVGYAILPQLEGEAHGFVVVSGAGVASLPGIVGAGTGTVGVDGRSAARLAIKAAATGDRGQVGTADAVLKLSVVAAGSSGARGLGTGVITLKGAAAGRHDDEEAAIMALLLAA